MEHENMERNKANQQNISNNSRTISLEDDEEIRQQSSSSVYNNSNNNR